MEGLIEVGIGLFLSRSISSLVAAFPMALVGGMMLLVGIQLGKGAIKLRGWRLALCLVTAALSVATNMVIGFVAGLALAYVVRALKRRCALRCLCPSDETDSPSSSC